MTTQSEEKINTDILAVIAAAVSLAIEGAHRITSVQPAAVILDTPHFVVNPWSMETVFQM